MGFKEQVENDVSVFLNLDEFAEIHNVNGVECPVVLTDDSTRAGTKALGGPRALDGLHGDNARLQVRESDLPTIPVQGTNFKLDGKLYKVLSCTANMGVLNISLTAHRMLGG